MVISPKHVQRHAKTPWTSWCFNSPCREPREIRQQQHPVWSNFGSFASESDVLSCYIHIYICIYTYTHICIYIYIYLSIYIIYTQIAITHNFRGEAQLLPRSSKREQHIPWNALPPGPPGSTVCVAPMSRGPCRASFLWSRIAAITSWCSWTPGTLAFHVFHGVRSPCAMGFPVGPRHPTTQKCEGFPVV
jgi:hypothetical protein